MERIIVDLVDLSMYSAANGQKRYILTMIDCFSKFDWAWPISTKDAPPIANIVETHFRQVGAPTIFHSDNGKEFIAEAMTAAMKVLNVHVVHGGPYHPQSQGQVERWNQSLEQEIAKWMAETGSHKWTTALLSFLDNEQGRVKYLNE